MMCWVWGGRSRGTSAASPKDRSRSTWPTPAASAGPTWWSPGKSARGTTRSCCYHSTVVTVERVQTGLRLERNVLKVLKGLAEYLDVSLGDLVEGIALHAFEGKSPFRA